MAAPSSLLLCGVGGFHGPSVTMYPSVVVVVDSTVKKETAATVTSLMIVQERDGEAKCKNQSIVKPIIILKWPEERERKKYSDRILFFMML